MRILSLLLVAVLLTGCVGMFDLDGSNARAAAQALVDAEYERTKQTVLETAAVVAVAQERTLQQEAYYAALVALQGEKDAPPEPDGTNHDGGATVGFSVSAGAGIGWPVILLLIFFVLGAIFVLASREQRY